MTCDDIGFLRKLQNEIGLWQDKTFGIVPVPKPLISHLKKEVDELLEAPYSREEYADCLLLLLGAARLAGISADMLVLDTVDKLKINKGRQGGPPDKNGVIEHEK